jgi:hypothetical protein
MTREERFLYHQIHPLKLATDIGTSAVSSFLLWQHRLVAGLVLAFLPSIVATASIVRWVDLGAYARSPVGRYVRRHMTHVVEAQRMTGQVVMWVGAWQQSALVIALGALVVVLAWLGGLGAQPPSLA